MRCLKEPLLRMRELLDLFLQGQQLGHANVAFVVGVARTFENWAGVRHASVPRAGCRVPGQTSSKIWPSFFFLASRYFCVPLCGAISSGTRSTISRPKPSMATYLAGLFVISRILRTPRSRRIWEPVP